MDTVRAGAGGGGGHSSLLLLFSCSLLCLSCSLLIISSNLLFSCSFLSISLLRRSFSSLSLLVSSAKLTIFSGFLLNVVLRVCAAATLMLTPSHTGTFYTLSPSLALIFLHGATLRSLAYRWGALSARNQPRRPVTVARRGARGREQSTFTPLRPGELMAIMAKFMIGNTPNVPSSQSGNVTLCVCRLEPRCRDSRPRPPLCHTQAAALQLVPQIDKSVKLYNHGEGPY